MTASTGARIAEPATGTTSASATPDWPDADALQATTRGLIAAMPASVQLPAGTGKTELLAETARILVAEHNAKVLLLTHTHAGVHAIRQRLARIGVGRRCTVATISSFAYGFARPYPELAGMVLPAVAIPGDSSQYVQAATRVARAKHLKRVLASSYTHLLVDEYQDCTHGQHDLICAIADAGPATAVFGDPMQAIFGFDEALVSWPEVNARFRDHPVPTHPWRWRDHSPQLGQWLLDLRARLVVGETIDLTAGVPAEVNFISTPDFPRRIAALKTTANRSRPDGESVVFLAGTTYPQTQAVAGQLGGRFGVMEDVGGAFMVDRLQALIDIEPSEYARWLGVLFKTCFCNHGGIQKAWLTKLANGKAISGLKAPEGVHSVQQALDAVLADPSLTTLANAMDTIRSASEPKLHSPEGWFEIQTAIRGAAARADPAATVDELRKARDPARHVGRRARTRLVSRTLLVKGLEFDHVVITDLAAVTDRWKFYVAMTRARKTVTVLGSTPMVKLTETPNGPKALGETTHRRPVGI